jgi:hypothetical protein
MQWLFSAIFIVPNIVFAQATGQTRAEKSIHDLTVGAPMSHFGDFDNDGLVDVYAIDPVGGDHLYKSRGDGRFTDVTEPAGLSGLSGTRMALWQDFDGDGRLDLYVCAIDGRSRLFQNRGGVSFADVTASAGIAHPREEELFAEWIDYDGDGLPDLHVVTIRGDRLFHNAGRGRFGEVDLSAQSGSTALQALVGATVISTGSSQNQTSNCAEGMVDQADPSNCIQASSLPTLGKLMPLSRTFSISGGNVGIRTAHPTTPLEVALGDKSFQIRRDGNLVPGINLTGTGGNVGILRLRNSLEIWPDDALTRSGRLVLFDTGPNAGCVIEGTGDAYFLGHVGIGTAPTANNLTVVGAIKLDYYDQNTGAIQNTLAFGGPVTGEAIGSKRDVGGNQNGLDFWTGFGIRMSVTNSGNVGIGTTSPTDLLDVAGGVNIDYTETNTGGTAGSLRFGGPASGEGILSKRDPGGNQHGLDFFAGTGVRMAITQIGDVGIGRLPSGNRLEVEGDASKTTAGGWLANSDRRIKTNVRTIDNALDTLDRVRPVAFRYTEAYMARHPAIHDKEYYNVIAQEFAEVFPDYVKDSGEDGILQVDTYPVLIHAIAAVKELHQVVKAKEQELAALQERVARLERAFATMTAADRRDR